MKTLTLTLAAALAALSPLAVQGEEAAKAVPTREESVIITMVAKVAAVNQETREVTLEDELGKKVTLVAGDKVQRLSEVAVGDTVEAEYLLSLAFELRAPTVAEIAEPLQIMEGGGRAAATAAPAGGAARVIKAVCTIEGLDRPTATVTLKGPLGGLNVVRVADVNNLPKLRIGDPVVVTFTEALAIGLKKVTP
jgi:hypothetical protein